MTDRITDAIECFQQMDSELAGETNMRDEQVKWAVGERWSSHACSVHVIDLFQTSRSIVHKSWNTSETSQQRPNNTMKL